MANNLLNNTVVSLDLQVALAGDRILIWPNPTRVPLANWKHFRQLLCSQGFSGATEFHLKFTSEMYGPNNIPDAITITAIPSLNDFLDRLEHWETIGNLARG